ncbi:Sec-independent protein translocase protein TatB [Microvirga guangxiensis]|uniref:Sec-independent protein translocase protein TatB n=1 Tax=Microvirga guangxiensis TaxID=549386 RepID=A0A1G5B2X7_9HYPH|nr:Sec-independent protein translocase protein TatB [Microvirga guangxiensis]SCX84523.1 sec-independent protein translocase protein TatB [Microvirga guangxiensis]
MLDMSWGEVMVIGAVALIVIGPKDLPRALRTVGQVTGKLRRMAAEFQGQFNEAIREAELDDVKKQLQGVNDSVSSLNSTSFNPIQTIRDELKTSIEKPVSEASEPPVPQPTGDASIQAIVEGRAPAPADPLTEPMIDLPPPPMDDPAEAIAESLRREAEIESQKKAAAAEALEKPDAKA